MVQGQTHKHLDIERIAQIKRAARVPLTLHGGSGTDDADLRRAHHRHWDTGGSIMIHGLPNELRREPTYYEKRDWTDGCIAVSDSDMLEIWLMTPPDTPIDILP